VSIFGTDGVRGVFGIFPITPAAFKVIGQALGFVLKEESAAYPHVLICCDTRGSSPLLVEACVSGLLTIPAVRVTDLGVLPTPALAAAVADDGATAGIIITASHNLAADNGLKIFYHNGIKLPQHLIVKVERYLHQILSGQLMLSTPVSGLISYTHGSLFYRNRLRKIVAQDSWPHMRLLIDCAHGAYSQHISSLLGHTAAQIIVKNNSPDGYNINQNAGVLRPEILQKTVAILSPDFSIAFDGDGDRLVFFMGKKRLDSHLLVIVLYHAYADSGYTGGIVMTEVSNKGLQDYCVRHHIDFEIVKVGDRHVMEKARQKNWFIGFEPSGHYMLLDKSPSADALLVAAVLINFLKEPTGQQALDLLEKELQLYDDYQINLPLDPRVAKIYKDIAPYLLENVPKHDALFCTIRPSGTEPLLRIGFQCPPGTFDLEAIAKNFKSNAEKIINYALEEES
jgi:phosphoglucosamine mutase